MLVPRTAKASNLGRGRGGEQPIIIITGLEAEAAKRVAELSESSSMVMSD